MSLNLDELEKRHAKRCEIIRECKQMHTPMITDVAAVKEFSSIIKTKQTELLDECYMIDRDVQALLMCLREFSSPQTVGAKFDLCWDRVFNGMPLEDQTRYYERMNQEIEKEQEAHEKDQKARGEVPGQQKMFKDDGSVAEAASPVTTTKAAKNGSN